MCICTIFIKLDKYLYMHIYIVLVLVCFCLELWFILYGAWYEIWSNYIFYPSGNLAILILFFKITVFSPVFYLSPLSGSKSSPIGGLFLDFTSSSSGFVIIHAPLSHSFLRWLHALPGVAGSHTPRYFSLAIPVHLCSI